MARDFFDDDLLQGAGGTDPDVEEQDGVTVQPITEVSLGRLVKQRQELNTQVAGAVKEIEHLRMRQEQLEKEKRDLQELADKQEDYEKGKREMIDRLTRSIVLLEKEEVQATRMAELLAMMRQRFKDMLDELRAIDEEDWSEENFQIELNKALVLVDDARMVFKKGMAKIEAAGWHRTVAGRDQPEVIEREAVPRERSFAHWLKVGLAVSLPLTFLVVALFVLYLFLMGMIG